MGINEKSSPASTESFAQAAKLHQIANTNNLASPEGPKIAPAFHELITRARDQPWPPDEILLKLAQEPLGRAELNLTEREASSAEIAHAQTAQDELIMQLLPRGRDGLAQIGLPVDSYDAVLAQAQHAPDDRARRALLHREHPGRNLSIYPLGEGFIQVAPAIMRLDNPTIKAKIVANDTSAPSSRFYLNPPTHDVPAVAKLIIEESENTDAYFDFKFADAVDPESWNMKDKLVIYAPQTETETVFEIIRRVKERMPEAFQDRPLPALVFPIEEGIGYADNPPGGKSYTNNRSQMLNDARQAIGGDALAAMSPTEQIATLRQAIAQAAPSRSIDPHNLAFNS